MEEERLKLLLNETNFNICIDFFARMIEKYGSEMDMESMNEREKKTDKK